MNIIVFIASIALVIINHTSLSPSYYQPGTLKKSTPLHKAAQKNDVQVIQKAIDQKEPLDCLDELKETPLHKAAQAGSYDALVLLINNGASIHARNAAGLTPLHSAAMCNIGADENIEAIIFSLVQQTGADPNVVCSDDKATPLHYAVRHGRINTITTLLRCNGININAADKNGWTPLHYAMHYGQEPAAHILLQDQRLIIDQVNTAGHSPLKMWREMAALMQRCNINHNNITLELAQEAIALGHTQEAIATAIRAELKRRNSKAVTPVKTLLAHTPVEQEIIAVTQPAAIEEIIATPPAAITVTLPPLEPILESHAVAKEELHVQANKPKKQSRAEKKAATSADLDDLFLHQSEHPGLNSPQHKKKKQSTTSPQSVSKVARRPSAKPVIPSPTAMRVEQAYDAVCNALEHADIDHQIKLREMALIQALFAHPHIDAIMLNNSIVKCPLIPKCYLNGDTLLNIYVDVGNYDAASIIIQKQKYASVILNTPRQGTEDGPLHIAIKKHYFNIAKLLIDQGADVNATAHGKTALDVALMVNQKMLNADRLQALIGLIENLIDHGAYYTFSFDKDIQGTRQHPLVFYAKKGNLAMVNALLRTGDVTVVGLAMRVLQDFPNKEIEEVLMPYMRIRTTLEILRVHGIPGDAELNTMLNENPALLNAHTCGITLLFLASINGQIDCVKFLLERGAKKAIGPGVCGTYPIHVANGKQVDDCNDRIETLEKRIATCDAHNNTLKQGLQFKLKQVIDDPSATAKLQRLLASCDENNAKQKQALETELADFISGPDKEAKQGRDDIRQCILTWGV